MVKKYLEVSKIVGLLIVMLVLSSCSTQENPETEEETKTDVVGLHTPKTLEKEIRELENLVANPDVPNHKKMVMQLIEYYKSYANLFGQNKVAPDMLFRAGNQSVYLQKYQNALKFYKTVELKYGAYIKRPECIYLQGFVYESNLNELGNAKEKYELVISSYPNHALAEQAKQSIENMGMSDEELIRKFENQNK